MLKRRVIIIGYEESFILHVLVKKVQSSGKECEFASWYDANLEEKLNNLPLVVLYTEGGNVPNAGILVSLRKILEERKLQIILAGDEKEVRLMTERIPEELVYAKFTRPIDNSKFVAAVGEYFKGNISSDMKRTVLVVDDDPSYLSMVREWLRGSYNVAMANSGSQAFKWLGRNQADLILLDYEMPVTTGPMVLEMLRSEEETKGIPVIFLTGKSEKESVMAVVALKPEGYILKSVKKNELLEKLQEFFILQQR